MRAQVREHSFASIGRPSQPASPGLTSGLPRLVAGLSARLFIIEWIGLVRLIVRGSAHDFDDLRHYIAAVAGGDAHQAIMNGSPDRHIRFFVVGKFPIVQIYI
jgi:hypothetical protein